MSTNFNKTLLGIAMGATLFPAMTPPFYAEEIQKQGSQKKLTPSRSYWLHSLVPDEGLCGNKMQPNVHVMTKEAENGNEFAAFRLGQLYRGGNWGVKKDIETARYWFKRAAKGGQRSAQIIMGQAYEFGRLNVQPDARHAIEYYQMANKQKFQPDIQNRIQLLEKALEKNQ